MGGSVRGSVDRGSVFCRNPEKMAAIDQNNQALAIFLFFKVGNFKSVRSKVVSIEGRFDRQKSIRSKTRVSSIEDCNYCLSVLNLLFIKSV